MKEITVGSPIEFQSRGSITQEQLKNYAQASGDFNLIHLDDEVAKKAGLPGVIAHGMLIAAQVAERARQFVSDQEQLGGFELVHFQTRFKAMTLLGDTPSYGGVVKEFNGRDLVLDLQAKNQRGEVTVQGTVRYRLMSS